MSPKTRIKDEPIESLMGMHQKVEAELLTRIDGELADLEKRLQELREFKQRMILPGQGPATSQKGIKIAPKYRNPENPNETWAGRGMYPKWLDQKLKAGAKLDDFKI